MAFACFGVVIIFTWKPMHCLTIFIFTIFPTSQPRLGKRILHPPKFCASRVATTILSRAPRLCPPPVVAPRGGHLVRADEAPSKASCAAWRFASGTVPYTPLHNTRHDSHFQESAEICLVLADLEFSFSECVWGSLILYLRSFIASSIVILSSFVEWSVSQASGTED